MAIFVQTKSPVKPTHTDLQTDFQKRKVMNYKTTVNMKIRLHSNALL